nr:hypothetical protein GCM10017611_01490 [Rhodococcus wratislaviensis]
MSISSYVAVGDSSDNDGGETLVAQLKKYRIERRRRVQSKLRSAVNRDAAPQDEEMLVTFAGRWAPYGGAPDEEVFINFGMAMHRFREKLREAVAAGFCDPRIADYLIDVYRLSESDTIQELPQAIATDSVESLLSARDSGISSPVVRNALSRRANAQAG